MLWPTWRDSRMRCDNTKNGVLYSLLTIYMLLFMNVKRIFRSKIPGQSTRWSTHQSGFNNLNSHKLRPEGWGKARKWWSHGWDTNFSSKLRELVVVLLAPSQKHASETQIRKTDFNSPNASLLKGILAFKLYFKLATGPGVAPVLCVLQSRRAFLFRHPIHVTWYLKSM